MPLMVWSHGKISFGHVFAGYLGLLLLGAASLAIGTFGSALTRSQMLAVDLVGGDGRRPARHVVARARHRAAAVERVHALALWSLHFPPFQAGIVHLRDVVYYVAITYVALFASTRVLEARRWR